MKWNAMLPLADGADQNRVHDVQRRSTRRRGLHLWVAYLL